VIFFIKLLAAIILLSWIYCLIKARAALSSYPPIQEARKTEHSLPFVSVIIPARNEAHCIEGCLNSLINLTYPHYEIIVVNDRSEDDTGPLLDRIASQSENIKVLHLTSSDDTWSGKNYALNQGVKMAKGDWFLFTDADTVHFPESIQLGLAEAHNRKVEFLSFLPRLSCHSLPEKLIQPVAGYLMALWYPLDKVNDSNKKSAFANGQYMLLSRGAYDEVGGHSAVKEKLLEDVALAEVAKAKHIPFHLGLGLYALKTRMYDDWSSIWEGWKRIFVHLTNRNLTKLVLSTMSLSLLGALPLLLLVAFLWAPKSASLSLLVLNILLFTIGVRWWLNRISELPGWPATLYPFSTLFVLGILLDSCIDTARGKKTKWRGVEY